MCVHVRIGDCTGRAMKTDLGRLQVPGEEAVVDPAAAGGPFAPVLQPRVNVDVDGHSSLPRTLHGYCCNRRWAADRADDKQAPRWRPWLCVHVNWSQ